jgi:hypothetical protein
VKPKLGRSKLPAKLKQSELPIINIDSEPSQIDNTQFYNESLTLASTTMLNQTQVINSSFNSTQFTQVVNNTPPNVEAQKEHMQYSNHVQQQSSQRISNGSLCLRLHQNTEYVHASKLPINFWNNLINHRFWYADLDNWD